MKKTTPDSRLEQLLGRLSEDLAEATDAELLEACADLGIEPGMKGSIVWLGLKAPLLFPYDPQKLAPSAEPNHGGEAKDASDPKRLQ